MVIAPGGQAADWQAIAAELDAQGCARTPRLLTPGQCRDLTALYDKPELFRSTIDMARHRFGSGHRAGQGKSAQILLRYQAGDWNALGAGQRVDGRQRLGAQSRR